MAVVSEVVVRHGEAVLRCTAPPGWAHEVRGRDTVLRAAADGEAFRPNVLVRVHDVPAEVGLDALVAMIDDELDALDAQGAAVERRGRVAVTVDGGSGTAVLAGFDVVDPRPQRMLQLHAFVEPDTASEDASDDAPSATRPVFHLVGTWTLEDEAGAGEAVASLVTSAAVRRGTRAAPR